MRLINDRNLHALTRKVERDARAQDTRADNYNMHDNSLRWHDPEQVRTGMISALE